MKYVIVFTWIDLLVCAAFALPIISDLTLSLLNLASTQLNFAAVEVAAGTSRFFVNLAGFFGALWNIAMLKSQEPNLHRVDLLARCWLILLIVFHINASDLSPIFAVFILTEIIGGLYKVIWMRNQAAVNLPY
ncbi:MAG: hypothetical protein AAF542_01355 [Pseudomonadota bacterium]